MTDFSHKPTLTGERIVLRPMAADDAASMFADLQDDDAVRLTGTHGEFSFEQTQQWTASQAGTDDRVDLAIVDRATNAWLGEVVITDWDADNRSCGFRIALSAGARNRGIGTEATRLVIDYVFDEIDDPPVNRLELEVYAFNPSAMAVYDRVGFRHEGTRREALRWEGEDIDALVTSMLRRDREAFRS